MSNPANDSGLISITDFHDFLFEKIVPVDEILDVHGEPIMNILPFWRKNELLPFIRKGQHISLSFAELIWLKVLDTLRLFSFPIIKTKKVCNYFFKDAYDIGLPEKNMKSHLQFLQKKKKAGTITEDEEYTLQFIHDSIQDEELLYVLKYDINYLTSLVTECLSERQERGVLIFNDGRVAETDGVILTTHAQYKIDRREPHIYLSIVYYLAEFIESKELSTIFMPQILDDNEKKVLKELKNKNVKEISIQLNDGKVKIKSSGAGIITGEKAAEIKKILGLANYQSITLDTLSDSTFAFKKTNKRV